MNDASTPVSSSLGAARKLVKAGRRHDAIDVYQSILSEEPNNVDCLLALADIRMKQRLPADAEALLNHALQCAPDNVAVHILFSSFMLHYGSKDQSVAHAERAVSLAPDSAEAAFALGKIRAELGMYAEACKAYDAALKIRPNWTDARTELVAVRRISAGNAPTKPMRMRPAIWPKQATQFENAEKLIRNFVLNDIRPPAPLLGKDTKVATLGSCFAANVAKRLMDLGLDVFFKPIGEDINNSYANRYLLDWIVDGVENEMSEDLESIYGAEQRAAFQEHFRRARVFIFTLGVAPAFFDRQTGAFVLTHGSAVEKKTLPQICEFRTTSVTENVVNLQHVISRIRELSKDSQIVLTVSPVPLVATYEMGSAVLADSLSKSILRVTVEEILRGGTPGLHYWPSYEIVRWLGPNLAGANPPVYAADDGNTRHVSNWLIDLIMKLFVEYFGDETLVPGNDRKQVQPGEQSSTTAGEGVPKTAAKSLA